MITVTASKKNYDKLIEMFLETVQCLAFKKDYCMEETEKINCRECYYDNIELVEISKAKGVIIEGTKREIDKVNNTLNMLAKKRNDSYYNQFFDKISYLITE